jgi:orotate phosphoribosyltransferase/AMMECR1 domain-containing protein
VTTEETTDRRRDLLARLCDAAILRSGPGAAIVGRAGRPAPWMLYCWPLTMTADGLALIGDVLVDRLAEFASTQVAAYGVGAMPIMNACVLRGSGRYTGVVVRAEAKRYGARRQIDGPLDSDRPIVLVDDAISSATSAMTGIKILEAAGYTVEGVLALVNFSRTGGAEILRARGYRVETIFDVWDDMRMPRPDRPPLYLRYMPEQWANEAVPDGLLPAEAARHVARHLVQTGEVLRPPSRFGTDDEGPGGVWVSFRRRSDDHRLAREGFWHFDPGDTDTQRDVVIAAAATLRALGPAATPEVLDDIKIAVSFFSPLERVQARELDFGRYGIVVRSRHIPAKMGGALPNTQLYTSATEQYRHARVVNAHIGDFEPHDIYRHDVTKRVEPGELWPAYGVAEATTDAWTNDPAIGTALVDRALQVVATIQGGDPVPPDGVPDGLLPDTVAAIAVSLYDRGLIGCAVAGSGMANKITVDEVLVDAARHALADVRFAERRAASSGPVSAVVSVLHEAERLGAVSADYAAWKLRAGRDSYLVRQGRRWAVFLDSVIPHYCWTKPTATRALLAKAGIESGPATAATHWTTYKTSTWASVGGRLERLESGGRRRTGDERITADDVPALAEHLRRRLDATGWPANRVLARTGRYDRTGHAARALHALQVLHAAGRYLTRDDWCDAAQRGIDHAIGHLNQHVAEGQVGTEPVPALRMTGWICGPTADAMLLSTVVATGRPIPDLIHALADRTRGWIRADGSVRPEGTLPSTADADYLPGNVLLALARYQDATGRDLAIDWDASREWYTRRFRLVHPWGLAYWHCQLWPLVARITDDSKHLDVVWEMADWMCERQLRADGNFLADMSPTPSWHTACAALGVASAASTAANAAASTTANTAASTTATAADVSDPDRVTRYRTAWQEAMRYLDRLLVREVDTYWMPDPAIAIGGIRAHAASFEMRVDCTSETLQALLCGMLGQ